MNFFIKKKKKWHLREGASTGDGVTVGGRTGVIESEGENDSIKESGGRERGVQPPSRCRNLREFFGFESRDNYL